MASATQPPGNIRRVEQSRRKRGQMSHTDSTGKVVSVASRELIERPYGRLYLLTPRSLGLKRMQLLLLSLDPGRRTRMHDHSSEEVFFSLSGNAVLNGGDEEFSLAPGDTAMLPARVRHRVLNPSTERPCELLIALSPPRVEEEVVYHEE